MLDEGRAHGAPTRDQLGEIALDPFAQADAIEIHAENGCVRKERREAIVEGAYIA